MDGAGRDGDETTGRDGDETAGRDGLSCGRLVRLKEEPDPEVPLAELARDVLWRETGFKFLDVSNDATGFLVGLDTSPPAPRPNGEDEVDDGLTAGLEGMLF